MENNLLEKIKKLLALSESSSFPSEAESAALLAQKLLVQNGLTKEDLDSMTEFDNPSKVKISTYNFVKFKKMFWHLQLAKLLSRNYRVESLCSTNSVCFIGYSTDVDVCMSVYTFLLSQILKCWKAYFKLYKQEHPSEFLVRDIGYSKKLKLTYILGFLEGLEEKFRLQVDKYNLALSLSVSEEVSSFVDKISTSKPKKIPSQKILDNPDVFSKGFQDGVNTSFADEELK